jgi:GDP-mannose 6-dehydrogenase
MREGSPVADFLHPPETPGKVFETTLGVAEMVKYLSNAFHAVKVTFANEVGTLCKNLGVDAQAVLRSSRRIPA